VIGGGEAGKTTTRPPMIEAKKNKRCCHHSVVNDCDYRDKGAGQKSKLKRRRGLNKSEVNPPNERK